MTEVDIGHQLQRGLVMTLNRIWAFAALCLVFSMAFFSVPSARAAALGVESTALTICSNQGLPAGYVVTASDVNAACPGVAVYRWTITPAGGSNVVQACFGSGYPAPYFITGISTVSSICAGFQGAMTLTLPSNGIATCSPSVIWNPWVITANAITTGQCGGYGISTVAQASEGLSVCSNSPIPAGWSATGGSSSIQCQPYLVQTLHRTASLVPGAAESPHYIRQGDSAILSEGRVQ
jgi:hypothetical protein